MSFPLSFNISTAFIAICPDSPAFIEKLRLIQSDPRNGDNYEVLNDAMGKMSALENEYLNLDDPYTIEELDEDEIYGNHQSYNMSGYYPQATTNYMIGLELNF